MSNLDISNIVTVSLQQAGAGLGNYNTSNIGLFTDETPAVSFGTDGYKLYLSPKDVQVDFGTSSKTYKMALAIFSQQPNILANNGYLCILTMEALETLDEAITRTEDLIQYFAIMSTFIPIEADILAAAAVVQSMNKMIAFVSRTAADVDPGGTLDLLRSGSFDQSRGLFYGFATDDTEALLMMASYVGRAFSTVFSGSNTTQTMHLKDLIGLQPDTSLDQTLLNKCQAAGVDVYASFAGIPKVFCSGKNTFFDRVYNRLWLVGDIQVAGFNALAQVSTKLPQTEAGIDVLKGAYRNVLEQAVTNQFAAPGKWNSPETFGNQDDFYKNISQHGYYIYSAPIAKQSAVDRNDRKAPLIQIAIKEAGAVHSSTIIININA